MQIDQEGCKAKSQRDKWSVESAKPVFLLAGKRGKIKNLHNKK